MAYPNGFTYVRGPEPQRVWSNVSSGATFVERVPVTLHATRNVIEADSDSTAIYGISCNRAADSFPGAAGKVLIEIPYPETVYATKIQTGVAASAISLGQAYGIEKSGNYLRLDPDSQTTPMLVVVGDEFGNTINSADSSVFVRWLSARLGIYSSEASTSIFAQV